MLLFGSYTVRPSLRARLLVLYYIYSLIILRRESDGSGSIEKSLLRRLNDFLGLVGLACVALSDIVEDAKSSWS